MMALHRESIFVTIGIAVLLAAAAWYADDPDIQHWPFAASPPSAVARLPDLGVSVRRIDWSLDGRMLFSHSRGIEVGKESLTLHFPGFAASRSPIDLGARECGDVVLAPDGLHFAVVTRAGELQWIDRESFETTTLLELQPDQLFGVIAVANHANRVVAADGQGTLYVCNPERHTLFSLPSDRPNGVCQMCFSHDDQQLLIARTDGSIVLWDLDSRKRLQIFERHALPAEVAAFLPCGERIISGGHDDSIRIWNIATGREEWRGEFGLNGIRALDVSADGTTAAWGGFDRRIIVWDLQRRCRRFECSTTAAFVTTLKFSPDSRTLAVAGSGGKIHLYDVQTATEQPGIDLGASRNWDGL